MILVGLLIGVLSGALSLVLPLEYKAETKVFILSRTPTGADPFTVVKTAERIGENLSHIVFTSSFFDEAVRVAQGQVLPEQFGETERAQRKGWQSTVDVGVVPGTGFLRVSAFHENPRQAAIIAQSVVSALIEKGWEYVGGEVQIKAVDNVVISRFPVRPNIPMNIVLGFVFGVLGVAVVELFRSPKHHHPRHMGPADWLRHL